MIGIRIYIKNTKTLSLFYEKGSNSIGSPGIKEKKGPGKIPDPQGLTF
jgi:hypothetical protein